MRKKNWLALIPLAATLFLILGLWIIFSTADRFTHNINPVLLDLGFAQIRYYGLVYVLGFLAVYMVLRRAIRRGELPMKEDQLESMILYCVLGVVVGARLFEVLIYNPGYYLRNPLEIIMLNKGGLSFHGALAGVIVTMLVFTRNKPIPFLQLTDQLVLPLAIVLALGRFANFINGELYGVETTLPWGVKFKDSLTYHHPTQIYESLKNLIMFGILYFMRSFRPRPGILSYTFLIAYGGMRFLIEYLKRYDRYGYPHSDNLLLGMDTAQLLCLVMVLAGIAGIVYLMRRPPIQAPTETAEEARQETLQED